jgi:hypothetical protein
MDGRFGKAWLLRHVETDESFEAVREALSTLDCLIIDEASMISAHTFEQVNCSGHSNSL